MSDDLLPIAKAVEELEPAVEAFAQATGLLGPVREFASWATDLIRYRRMPHQAQLLLRAAEKIRESGLPASAVEDRLLRTILEEGPLADDVDMRDRWANLLANASTSAVGTVKVAYPRILSELEPMEASTLDRLARGTNAGEYRVKMYWITECLKDGMDLAGLENLNRLALVHYVRSVFLATTPPTTGLADDRNATIEGVKLTELGWAFVRACQDPPKAP